VGGDVNLNGEYFAEDPSNVLGIRDISVTSGDYVIGSFDLYVPKIEIVPETDVPYLRVDNPYVPGTLHKQWTYAFRVKPDLPREFSFSGYGDSSSVNEGELHLHDALGNTLPGGVFQGSGAVTVASDLHSSMSPSERMGAPLTITCRLIDRIDGNTFTFSREYRIVPFRLDFAVDGNRDGNITYDYVEDNGLTFWANDDNDEGNMVDSLTPSTPRVYEEDDLNNQSMFDGIVSKKDCDDDKIDCKRDLEDFRKMRYRIWPSDLLSDTKIKVLVRSTGPKISLFNSINDTPDEDHIFPTPNLEAQIAEKRKLLVQGSFVSLPDSLDKPTLGKESASWLFEGCSAGSGTFEYKMTWKGLVIAAESVGMEFKDIKKMYERYTIGDTPLHLDNEADPTPKTAWSTENGDSSAYILLVHGWNMSLFAKTSWAETMYKRLWWLGYKGRFGVFCWPTADEAFRLNPSDSSTYDDSDVIAWKSGSGLKKLLVTLRSQYSNLYLYAHSMGNVVAGEALRQYGLQTPLPTTKLKGYIAARGAVPAEAYDPTISPVAGFEPTTPRCYAYYRSGAYFHDSVQNGEFDYLNEELWESSSGGQSFDPVNDKKLYFGPDKVWNTPAGAPGTISPKPYFDPEIMNRSSEKFINFQNREDWALRYWWTSNTYKPDVYYDFDKYDYFTYGTIPFMGTTLTFENDRPTIFGRIVESRTRALGASYEVKGAFESNNESNNVELCESEPRTYTNIHGFDNTHPGHSKEFRSYIQQQIYYWKAVLVEFGNIECRRLPGEN
jgi:hypothetical protein